MATTAYYGTRLSPHISRTPEGFLIAHDVPLCRTAEWEPMLYRGSEVVRGGSDDVVEVYRSTDEVLHPKHLASLEGKPVLEGHGGAFVDADTAGWRAKGHVQNIREGGELPNGESAVIGDIVITDAALAEKILDGHLREVSEGYSCQYGRNIDGSYSQRKLRANHVAIVPDGRAGEHVRIYDSEPEQSFEALCRRFHRLNPAEVAAARAAEQRVEDRLPESLLRGEPHSWDEIAEIHRQLTEGEEVNNEDRDEIEEISGLNDSPDAKALDHLRKMRPFIEASGDRKAIDHYNAAIKDLKRRMRHNTVSDAARQLSIDIDPDRMYAETLKHYHRVSPKEGKANADAARASRVSAHTSRVVDRSLMSDEAYGEAIREAGRKMREKKY